MKLVDRLIIRDIVGPFLFGVAAFSSLAFAFGVLLKITDFLMRGMPFPIALEIVAYSLPSILFLTLPMSTLLGVLMGIGRLSGESEVVALFAGGISLYRMALPILGMGIIISGCSLTLNEVIAPIANSRSAKLQAAVFKQAAAKGQSFTLEDTSTNSRIIVEGGLDEDKGLLRDVTVVQFTNNRPSMLVYANRAQWAGLYDKEKVYRWKLYDGYTQYIDPSDPHNVATTAFRNTQTREIVIQKTPGELSMFKNLTSDQMSFGQLSRMVEYLWAHPDRPWNEIRQFDVDRWNKIAVPLTSLIFALMAAPLGIRPQRSSSGVGFGLSILVILLYWIVGRYTFTMAVQGNVSPIVGAFAPNVLGFLAAIVLLVSRQMNR